jgi:predicted PurR-regulated permease PerM
MQKRVLQNGFFIAVVLLTTVAFLGVVQNFLQPVFWAAVLATIFYPMHRWWLEKTGGREALASVCTLLVIVVIVIFPLFLVGLAVAQEASTLYERIASGEIDLRAAVQWVEDMLPVAGDFLGRFGMDLENLQQRLSSAAVGLSRSAASQIWAVGQNAFRVAVLFFLMLYLLFFFLRDGERIIAALIGVLPLGDDRERQLLRKFAQVAQATIKGTLVVGIVQGTLGGTIFWLLGIGGAVLWGVVMTVLSFLPAVGAAVVWAPAAIVLIVSGSTLKGIALLVFGTLIIGLADNVLRPILVGRETKMPDYLVLLATLGGLTLFGVSGFVIGPIIAALFLTVWDMFGREFGSDTSSTRSSELEPHDPPGTENPEAPDDSSPTPPESSSAGSEDEDAVLNPE